MIRALPSRRSSVAMSRQIASSMPITAAAPAPCAGEDALLGRDIPVHVAVPVEMVGGDVEQHRDIEGERLDQVELKRTRLQNINPVRAERRQRQRRRAEIAADFDPLSGLAENVADQRRRRRFAVGAGNPDITRRRLRASEQFDIADDLDPGLAGTHHCRMRLGKGQRDAGRQHQRGNAPPVHACRIDQVHLAGDRIAHLGAVIPGQHLGPAFKQRAHRRAPRFREAQNQ